MPEGVPHHRRALLRHIGHQRDARSAMRLPSGCLPRTWRIAMMLSPDALLTVVSTLQGQAARQECTFRS